MCFSAEASFVVGGALLPVGAYCVARSFTLDRRFLPIAALPILFGIQQACEGTVWIGLQTGNQPMVHLGTLGFLLFALGFWPGWMALSVYWIAATKASRRLVAATSAAGFALGLLLYLPVLALPDQFPVASVVHHMIRYEVQTLPLFRNIPSLFAHLVYLAFIAVPMAIVGTKELRIFAALVVVSAAVAHVVYWYAFVSVWCIFAAILSTYLGMFFRRLGKAKGDTRLSPGTVDPRSFGGRSDGAGGA